MKEFRDDDPMGDDVEQSASSKWSRGAEREATKTGDEVNNAEAAEAEEQLEEESNDGDDGLGVLLEQQRDKYLRLAAEYDNYRRRSAKERQELTARAQGDLAKQLVDALDDLSRFSHLDPTAT